MISETQSISYYLTTFQITHSFKFLPQSIVLHDSRLVLISRLSIPYRTGQQCGTFDPPISFRKKYRPYQPISSNTGRYRAYRPVQEKSFFFFILSFVMFEFLLGQNGNLFVLTYQYYLFSQYAMVTFKLSILFFYFFPI